MMEQEGREEEGEEGFKASLGFVKRKIKMTPHSPYEEHKAL